MVMSHNAGATAYSGAYFGEGSGPILLDNVQCVNSEPTLIQCTHATQHNCHHSEDAGVRCLLPGELCYHLLYFGQHKHNCVIIAFISKLNTPYNNKSEGCRDVSGKQTKLGR